MGALLRDSFDSGERRRLAGFFGGVGLLHIAGWGLLFAVAAGQPTILALGGLAYTFGLRHAFDADHISAIDNTTRKLLQDGRKPVGVGFFFSLGHSSVVFLIAAALGLTVKWIVDGVVGNGGQLRSVGGVLGTVVSGGSVLIGVLNLIILLDIVRVYRRLKSGRVRRRVARARPDCRRIREPDLRPTVPSDQAQLADVSDRFSFRARLRYGL